MKVLDDGFVELVDYMGSDADIVRAARISYGNEDSVSDEMTPSDIGLLRYLMRHHHTTPFEMVEFKFHIRIPMDAWRQMIRHRTASVNEYSTRYKEAIDSCQKTRPDQWRKQAVSNKQGSEDFITEWPDEEVYNKHHTNPVDDEDVYVKGNNIPPGEVLSRFERAFHAAAQSLYQQRLHFGVAREQARKDLPLSTYTEAYWKIDLHNLLHFLRLRLDSHAQLEIRSYAEAIFRLIEPIVPITIEAFQEYRLNSVSFSATECSYLKYLLTNQGTSSDPLFERYFSNEREITEFKQKLYKVLN